MNKLTCKRCGHQWLARVENPLACPNCKQRTWNKDKKIPSRPAGDLNPARVESAA